MKISIKIDPPSKKGHFAYLQINKEDNDENSDSIRLDFHKLHDFADDTSSTAFDFLIFSLLIYCIDKSVTRHRHSVDGWSRELEVCFPVLNPDIWNNVKEDLEKTLSFLTGDYWLISFEQRSISLYPHKKTRWQKNQISYNKNEYRAVSLFSGGLDSLVGVIDNLEEYKMFNSKLLLASHYDGGNGAKSDQERLLPYLKTAYENQFEYITCGGRLNNNLENNREPSSRSRSMLFIGIGIYLANSINNNVPLLIPENGTISLNFPLSPSRRSSCSTRTTHPHFLSSLEKILKQVGINNSLVNPYQFRTKGELLLECKNMPLLKQCAFQSVSCGKRGHNKMWDNKTPETRNCGKCMPCIYRRAALNCLNLDTESFGIDIFTSNQFDINSNNTSARDITACLSFLQTNHSKKEVIKQLIINGSLESSKVSDYADVVLRTKDELKSWIQSKNNPRYNNLAGII